MEGQKIIWMIVWYGGRGDIGGPGLPNNFQKFDGRSGKGGSDGIPREEAHHVFGWAAGEHNIVLYADSVCIAIRNPIWLHMIPKAMVSMFDRVGLLINICKTRAMV